MKVETPLLVPVLVALPVCACMAILGLVRERLHSLATQLDPRQFQRVHRSTIVRLDMIAELRCLTNRDALLRLRDGSLLRASRTYMPALTDALSHLNKKAA